MRNFIVTVDGKQYEVGVEEVGVSAAPSVSAQQIAQPVAEVKAPAAPAAKSAAKPAAQAPANGTKLEAPMPGMIKKLTVPNGSAVKKGDVIVILEAMKMDNDLNAPCDGTITYTVTQGANVETGATLAVIA